MIFWLHSIILGGYLSYFNMASANWKFKYYVIYTCYLLNVFLHMVDKENIEYLVTDFFQLKFIVLR